MKPTKLTLITTFLVTILVLTGCSPQKPTEWCKELIVYKNHTINNTVYVNVTTTDLVYVNVTHNVSSPDNLTGTNFELIRRLKFLENREQHYLNLSFEDDYNNCTTELDDCKETVNYLNKTC